MPACFEYLWSWFLRMSNRRGGEFGPAALTHSGMKDFFELAGIEANPWEVEQLEALDNLYLKTCNEQANSKTNSTDKREKHKRE